MNYISRELRSISTRTSLQTCGTYAIDPQEYTDPWTSCISPNMEFNNDDLPEPTWEIVNAIDVKLNSICQKKGLYEYFNIQENFLFIYVLNCVIIFNKCERNFLP